MDTLMDASLYVGLLNFLRAAAPIGGTIAAVWMLGKFCGSIRAQVDRGIVELEAFRLSNHADHEKFFTHQASQGERMAAVETRIDDHLDRPNRRTLPVTS